MNMRRLLNGYVLYSVVTILFAVSLAISFHNVLRHEGAGQITLTHELWAVSQMEIEHLRFLAELGRFPDGDSGARRDLMDRFDVLWSRPPVLLNGSAGQRFREIPGAEALIIAYQKVLREIDPVMVDLAPTDTARIREVRDRLSAFSLPLHNTVRSAYHATDRATLFRNRELGEAYVYLLASLTGVVLFGGLLVVFLVRQVRKVSQAERMAMAARHEAETASRAKSDFLAHMSHELRTPLNAIIGFAEAMEQETFGPVGHPRYVEYLQDIRSSGAHLLSVISDILDTAKIEAGRFELDESVVDLDETVQTAVRLVRPHSANAGIHVSTDIPPGFPALRGDRRLILQSVLNLLSNAIKFTPHGGAVSVDAEQLDDERVLIRVRDTGPGMTEAEIVKALRPYGQVDPNTKRRRTGVGLGLPLVKSFTELHGGELAIESTPGRGTLVIISLPGERMISRAAAA